MNARRLAPRLFLLACVTLAVIWVGLNRGRLDPAVLDTWLAGLGVWAAVTYVGLYAVGTVVFVPGLLFALAGGALFGPFWGTMLNLLGATIGASLAFLIARYLAGDWVAQKAAGRLKRLINGVETEGWRFVAFVRLVPLFPFNLTNYALGLTRIGFWPYVVTSLICMAPGAVAYTWLGHAGREAIAGDTSAIRYGLLALGLLATIAFLPRLISRMRKGEVTTWTEPDELDRKIESGMPLTILDVRGADEFTGLLGHIPSAVNIPLGELDRRVDELRPSANGEVAVICRTDRRSAAAQAILRNAGFKNVVVLRGGMERWAALGRKTVRDGSDKGPMTT
ncbi:MAG: VTT domain-containing protein [Gammaproteobacteria bacterium]|nr:VTT domain-containing protein [Gammaproteobacteria bacterium]